MVKVQGIYIYVPNLDLVTCSLAVLCLRTLPVGVTLIYLSPNSVGPYLKGLTRLSL